MDTIKTVLAVAAAIFLAIVAWHVFTFVIGIVTFVVSALVIGGLVYLAFRYVWSTRGRNHRRTTV